MTSLLKLTAGEGKEDSNFTGVFALLGISAICMIAGGIALLLTLWLHSSWLGPAGAALVLLSFPIDKAAERWADRKLKASQLELECSEADLRAAQVDLGYAEAVRQEWN